MIAEKAVELRVEIIRQQCPLRTQLQDVRKRLVEFFEVYVYLGPGARSRASNSAGSARSRFSSAPGCSRRTRAISEAVLDQPHGAPRAIHFFQQHADVHPFVANQIRRIAQIR